MKSTTNLITPINAISFDCDSTLSSIEGIDVLAHENNVGNDVAKLTAIAMNDAGLSPKLYQDRLDLVKPTLSQLLNLATQYRETKTKDLDITLAILKILEKAIFIISAGNNPAIKGFGKQLAIPEKNIYAVDIIFNKEGQYSNFDRYNPLTRSGGKNNIIKLINRQYKRIAHIGDGLNDLDTQGQVTRFIGFGGHAYRKNIEQKSNYYTNSQSMLAILPFILTKEEVQSLPNKYKIAYEKFKNTDYIE